MRYGTKDVVDYDFFREDLEDHENGSRSPLKMNLQAISLFIKQFALCWCSVTASGLEQSSAAQAPADGESADEGPAR